MRGKRVCRRNRHVKSGITPAGAGKTGQPIVINADIADHPRRCGENWHVGQSQPSCSGSPPQVRGKLVNCGFVCLCIRITPAGAGKTLCPRCLSRRSWDHPRRCGENWYDRELGRAAVGSPPQVRGKLCQCGLRRPRSRITPAGAGKTSLCCRWTVYNWDHPRRCGENSDAVKAECERLGSPPQVRGKLPGSCGVHSWHRITPAGAGKTVNSPVPLEQS